MRRFWSKVATGTGCWEWQAAKNKLGYGVFMLGGDKTALAHRLAWALAYGVPGDKQVLHRCDNPGCVNPKHLWLGTNDDNQRDKALKGRSGKKLCAREVRQIRRMYAAGRHTQQQLADTFGIGQAGVSRIIRRVEWQYA